MEKAKADLGNAVATQSIAEEREASALARYTAINNEFDRKEQLTDVRA